MTSSGGSSGVSSNAIVNILPNMSIREAGDKWRSRGNLICMYVMGTGGCLHVHLTILTVVLA